MPKYTVHWVEKLHVRAQGVEADSPEDAIDIAKNTQDLDIDTDAHHAKPTNYRVDLEWE